MKVGTATVKSLTFVDDTACFANTFAGLQKAVTNLTTLFASIGVRVNFKKCYYSSNDPAKHNLTIVGVGTEGVLLERATTTVSAQPATDTHNLSASARGAARYLGLWLRHADLSNLHQRALS